MKTINIYKDGQLKKTFENETSDFCALKWLLNNQPNSTDHAIRHEGYKVEIIDSETGKKDYWKPYGKINK